MKKVICLFSAFLLLLSSAMTTYVHETDSQDYLSIPSYNETYSAHPTDNNFLSLKEYNTEYSNGENPLKTNSQDYLSIPSKHTSNIIFLYLLVHYGLPETANQTLSFIFTFGWNEEPLCNFIKTLLAQIKTAAFSIFSRKITPGMLYMKHLSFRNPTHNFCFFSTPVTNNFRNFFCFFQLILAHTFSSCEQQLCCYSSL